MSISPRQAVFAWLEALGQRSREIAYVLYVVAAAAGLGGAILIYKDYQDNLPFWMYLATIALIALGNGLWLMLREAGSLTDADAARLVVLTVGGLTGLATTVVLGIGLTWKWWETVSGGWPAWTGAEGTRLWWVMLAVVSGLLVMFLSLQLARPDERTNPVLRRLLYGYNAILTGLLVFATLLVLNLLTYFKWDESPKPWKHLGFVSRTHDWSRGSLYSLSKKSEDILKDLQRTIQVKVVLSTQDHFYPPVRALLDNCQAATDRLQVEYLSPTRNQQRVKELEKEFEFDGDGILVLVGVGDRTEKHLIRKHDLVESGAGRGQSAQNFNGEAVLLSAINHLASGGEKPILYFTQGNDEPNLTGVDGSGMSQLKQRLETRGFYQVKGLRFIPDPKKGEPAALEQRDTVTAPKVPDDAGVVVVVGPRRALPDFALKALEEYVSPPAGSERKPGQLIVLLDVVPNKDRDGVLQTGLEAMLARRDVQVGNDILLHDFRLDRITPAAAITVLPPRRSQGSSNPIVEKFAGEPFILLGARTVKSESRPRPDAGRFSTEVLLEAPPELGVWAETDVRRASDNFVLQLIRSGTLREKLSPTPLPVAVAVSEGDSMLPADAAHAHLRSREQKPRMVVMGNADWVTNRPAGQTVERSYDLFSGYLDWLRGRPASIGIEPKRPDVYEWDPKANLARIILLPGILTGLMIVGLGAGVWIVRRR